MSDDLPQNSNPNNGYNNGNNNQQQQQQYGDQQFNNNNNNSSSYPFFEDVTDQRVRNLPIAENMVEAQVQQEHNSPKSSSPSRSSSRSVSSSSSSEEEQKWQYQSIKEGEQQVNAENQVDVGDGIAPKQAMRQKKSSSIRYKYCCKKCKHADRDKNQKACVCVVPRDQRRTHLGNQGCQTCGCDGCSKEDFLFRGEDPQYHPEDKKKQNKKKEQEKFQARNGCCKNCMKAFSKSGKSCICQVPQDVRKTKLSSSGCKICGCTGCNPEDKKSHHHHKSQRKTRRSRSRSQRRKQKHSKRSHSRQKKRRSRSRSPEIIDTFAMNFHNIDRSIIGSMIINEYQIDPALLGFGIPQRSSSYLFGRNRQK